MTGDVDQSHASQTSPAHPAMASDEADKAAALIAERFLSKPTAKQRILSSAFRAPDSRFQPICRFLTLDECAAAAAASSSGRAEACDAVHFEPIHYPQTDVSLGHCSYLNTCHRTNRCKYLHFRPIRKPSATPFVWRSIYPDVVMPVRQEAPLPAGAQGNLYGHAQPTTLDGSEQAYVDALVRHPARALHTRQLERWTRRASTDDGIVDDPLSGELMPAQWIDADVKTFDMSILGKFDVILADPPWDIHMSLPYGTMSDDDMRAMPIPALQDEGFLFLWVTGRAMELGRELLGVWGYTRVDEIVWVKVGQTQRLIRTGRTGHWLNHTKEHCLVGVKAAPSSMGTAKDAPGARPKESLVSPLTSLSTTYPASHAPGVPASKLLPAWANAGLDADIIVAEVRDTSRKPDELYSIIERLCPQGRKVELFGRRHNARPGWITVGNQLKGDQIVEAGLRRRVEAWRQAQQQV